MSETTTEQPLASPDPEAVKSLLAGNDLETTSKQFEVDPEIIKDLAPADVAQAEPVRAEIPLDNTTAANSISTRNMLSWSMSVPDVGEIEVESTEKALFLKAALNDEELQLPITLEYGDTKLKVMCRALSTWEMDVLYGAMNADEKDEKFRDIAQYTTALQQYTLAMQTISVNETSLNCLRYSPSDDLYADVTHLRLHAKAHVGKWNSVRWSIVLLAARVFTVKLKLCTDAAMNRDFWSPPGTV